LLVGSVEIIFDNSTIGSFDFTEKAKHTKATGLLSGVGLPPCCVAIPLAVINNTFIPSFGLMNYSSVVHSSHVTHRVHAKRYNNEGVDLNGPGLHKVDQFIGHLLNNVFEANLYYA
jgi:hypothetical protein